VGWVQLSKGYVQLGSCELPNEHSCFMKDGEYKYELNDYQFHKKSSLYLSWHGIENRFVLPGAP
jgi:hypothetical protein